MLQAGMLQLQRTHQITCALAADLSNLIKWTCMICVADVLVLLLRFCRTEDSSWDVMDSVFVTIAKGAPAGEAAMSATLTS
jgi:hypothetical protein